MATESRIEVARSSSHVLRLRVKKGDVVRWSFTVADGYDIGLEIRQPSGFVLQPMIRLASDAGSAFSDSDGELQVIFDNGYSMLRGKVVLMKLARGPLELTIEAARADGILDPESANALVMKGLDLFFSNKFDESERFFASFDAPIFLLSLGAVQWMRGILSWERATITAAQEKLQATVSKCKTIMPQESVWSSVTGTIFGSSGGSGAVGSVTPAQLDATIIAGEATLLGAILHLTDESLMGIVRFAMAVRGGFALLQKADRLLGEMVSKTAPGQPLSLADAGAVLPVADDVSSPEAVYGYMPCPSFPRLNRHTLGGVYFGLGAFNNTASTLPPIAVRLIAALGFPCDRDAGMQQLRRCLGMWGVRSPLSALFLLVQRALFPSFASTDISDNVPEAEAVLATIFRKYPDSAFFSWLSGRLARMQGNVALARERLQRCASVGLVQFAQLADYELAWSYAFLHDWRQTQRIFRALTVENDWSKAFYAFMTGAALIQQGRIAEGREALKRAIKLSGRKLGGKVISAEQFALKRAAEFVALTYVDGPAGGDSEAPPMGPDETVLQPSVLASLPKMRLPAVVTRGSEAHACVLGYGIPLIGLESVYLFNGATQMDKAACRSGIAQCDAVLKAVAKGLVFDSAAPVWQHGPQTPAAALDGALAWVDRHKPASSAESAEASAGRATSDDDVSSILSGGNDDVKDEDSIARAFGLSKEAAIARAAALEEEAVALIEAQITSMLDAAAGVTAKSLSSAGAAEAAAAATKAWAALAAASPAAAAGAGSSNGSNAGQGGRLSIRGFMSSVASAVKSSPREDGAGGASPAVSSPSITAQLNNHTPIALPSYAVPSQLQPVHTAAVAALIRGALCSRIGLIDSAATCFRWVVESVGPSRLKRDLHVYAYAAYELSVLYVDAVKAIARREKAKKAGIAADASSLHPITSHCGADILKASLYKGMTVKTLSAAAKRFMAVARDVKDDFPWKLRLHLRIHLTADDLRVATGKKQGKKILGGAAAATAAATSAGGAGSAGAGSGGGDAEAAAAASRALEADLLKQAEGPMGADTLGEGDDDEDDEDGDDAAADASTTA